MAICDWTPPRGGWPSRLFEVPYLASAGPESTEPPHWLFGSNCQRYACGLLALFDRACPPLRSSELWEDRDATIMVEQPAPLDLVLFNASKDPYGAHVGVWMASDEVLHLSKEVGAPAVWSLGQFACRPRYAMIVGVKRVTARSSVPPER
jgi:hypothetical protein